MWVLPTFGRPRRCQETLDSIIAMGAATPGLVIVDGDTDPAYRTLRLPQNWRLEIGLLNVGFCTRLNDALAKCPGEAWYGWLADDFIVATREWDLRLIAAAGRRNFAYPADGWMNHPLTGAFVAGGDLLRALGWWAPPGLWHMYADNAWQRIAAALGNLVYRPDVVIEHRHHLAGKAMDDATYRHARGRCARDHDVFQRFSATELPVAIDRARALWRAVPAAL